MTTRLKLHQRLTELVNGAAAIYYLPPSNLELSYPACIYSLDGERSSRADNRKYQIMMSYQVKLILTTIESPLLDKFVSNPEFTFITYYPTGTLHNFIFKTVA